MSVPTVPTDPRYRRGRRVLTTLTVDPGVLDRASAAATALGVPRARLLRLALDDLLARWEASGRAAHDPDAAIAAILRGEAHTR